MVAEGCQILAGHGRGIQIDIEVRHHFGLIGEGHKARFEVTGAHKQYHTKGQREDNAAVAALVALEIFQGQCLIQTQKAPGQPRGTHGFGVHLDLVGLADALHYRHGSRLFRRDIGGNQDRNQTDHRCTD